MLKHTHISDVKHTHHLQSIDNDTGNKFLISDTVNYKTAEQKVTWGTPEKQGSKPSYNKTESS